MFVRVIRKTVWQRLALLLAIGIGCAALLIWPEGAAGGVSRGLSVCGTVIVPSLFPFLVLSGVFIRSGLAARVGQRLDGVTRRLFGLPGCCGAVVLVGMVGGYPAGAAATKELLRNGEIGEKQAKHLLRFCVNGGPAFIIGTVGAGLLGSVSKGIMLYAAHLLASLVIGIVGRGKAAEEPLVSSASHQSSNMMKTLVESVQSACGALVSMCGFVVLFSAFLTLSDVSGLTRALTGVIAFPFTEFGADVQPLGAMYTAFWEVSCGCVEIAGGRLGGMFSLFLLGAALGWGGVSVQCQIGGMFSDENLLDSGFVLARAWHALLGGGIAVLLSLVIPLPQQTTLPVVQMMTSPMVIQPVSVSVGASAAMLLMCGALLLSTSREG